MFSLHMPPFISSLFHSFRDIGKTKINAISVAASTSAKVFKESTPLIKGIGKKSIFAAVILLSLVGVVATIAAIFAAVWFIAKKYKVEFLSEENVDMVTEYSDSEDVWSMNNSKIENESEETVSRSDNFEITEMNHVNDLPPVINIDMYLNPEKPIHKNFVVKNPPINRNRVLPSVPFQTVVNELFKKPAIDVLLEVPRDRPVVVNESSLHQSPIPARKIEAYSSSQRQVMDFNSQIRQAKQPISGRRLPTNPGKEKKLSRS